MKITIQRKTDGHIEKISRDVQHSHPCWIHEQLGTASERELQVALDQIKVDDYADGSRDNEGVLISDID